MAAEITAALAPSDLTHVQFVLLACAWWLNEHGERPSQVAVARQAGTDVKMTSQVLRDLERRGLLDHEAQGDDARVRAVVVTPEGATLARVAIAVVEAADRESSTACRGGRCWGSSAGFGEAERSWGRGPLVGHSRH